MARNLSTSLRRRTRTGAMAAHDALPAVLRAWAAAAALPWSAISLRRAWSAALASEAGNRARALRRLDMIEARALARDATRIWGAQYPVRENCALSPQAASASAASTTESAAS